MSEPRFEVDYPSLNEAVEVYCQRLDDIHNEMRGEANIPMQEPYQAAMLDNYFDHKVVCHEWLKGKMKEALLGEERPPMPIALSMGNILESLLEVRKRTMHNAPANVSDLRRLVADTTAPPLKRDRTDLLIEWNLANTLVVRETTTRINLIVAFNKCEGEGKKMLKEMLIA